MAKKKDRSPAFKPGSKPYCYYGKEILNKDVPWHEVIIDIEEKGYSLLTIASIAETQLAVIQEVVKQQFDNLPFRAGTKIISLHYRLCPSAYIEREEDDEANA